MQPIKEDEPAPLPKSGNRRMSSRSQKWDKDNKGFLTEAEIFAKDMDEDGKGYLDAEEALRLGERIVFLLEANKKVRRMIWFLVTLVLVLFAATVAATIMAVENSKELSVDENGILITKDGSSEITIHAQGIKVNTYQVTTSSGEGTKLCIDTADVALIWIENENGGTATIVSEAESGDESVERITAESSRMTSGTVTFGNLVLSADPDCTDSQHSGDHVHRLLKHHVRSLREGYLPGTVPRLLDEDDDGEGTDDYGGYSYISWDY